MRATSRPLLFALILFASFNNFLGGIFMALMDAYGLSLVSVQAWGLLWRLLSMAFILSGIVIARTGLGAKPLRTLLLVNRIMWAVCCVFTALNLRYYRELRAVYAKGPHAAPS